MSSQRTEHYFDYCNGRLHVQIERDRDAWRVSVDGATPKEVRATEITPGTIELELEGSRYRIHLVRQGRKRLVAAGSDTIELTLSDREAQVKSRRGDEGSGGSLEAAMPGQVVAVAAKAGDEVARGQTLLVLEAMKMELRVTAPQAGRVRSVLVQAGQVVERGQKLAELD